MKIKGFLSLAVQRQRQRTLLFSVAAFVFTFLTFLVSPSFSQIDSALTQTQFEQQEQQETEIVVSNGSGRGQASETALLLQEQKRKGTKGKEEIDGHYRQNSFEEFEQHHTVYERMRAEEKDTSHSDHNAIRNDGQSSSSSSSGGSASSSGGNGNSLRGKGGDEIEEEEDWFFPPVEEIASSQDASGENQRKEGDYRAPNMGEGQTEMEIEGGEPSSRREDPDVASSSSTASTSTLGNEDSIETEDRGISFEEERETAVFIPSDRVEFMEDLWYKWSYTANDFDAPTRTNDYVDGYIIEPSQKMCGTTGTPRCGPNNWKFLHTECNGILNKKQSPINLPAIADDYTSQEQKYSVEEKKWEKESSPNEVNERLDSVGVINSDLLEPILFSDNYGCTQGKLIADTHTWEVLLNECHDLSITYLGSKYDLQQFHFHSPSEHTIDGKYYDAEAHFVHFSEETEEYTVLGVFIEAKEEEDNPFISEFWENEVEIVDNVNKKAQEDGLEEVEKELRNEVEEAPIKEFPSPIDPYDFFMPSNRSYYMYQGSLTTPNCGTNVNWVVFNEVAVISRKQLEQYRDGVTNFPMSQASPNGDTNRPVQELGQRNIYFFADTDGDDKIRNFEPKPSSSGRRKKRSSHAMNDNSNQSINSGQRRKLVYEAKKEERKRKRDLLASMKKRQQGMKMKK